MKSFYNNITIIPLILKNIKNNQWKLIIAKKQVMYISMCKAIHASHIYSQQNKYCLTMQTNILKKKKKTPIMNLAKTKQNNIIYPKTKVRQKIPHFF